MFGGVSNTFYGGDGILGSNNRGAGKATTSRPSHITSTPDYHIAKSIPWRSEGKQSLQLVVFTDSLYREDLKAIADNLIETQDNADWVAAVVYDSDEAIYDPAGSGTAKPRDPRVSPLDMKLGGIFINFSMGNDGELKEGYYSVMEDCRFRSSEDCSYTYPVE